MSLSSFFGGAGANASYKENKADRSLKERQLGILEREEERGLAEGKVSQISNLARDLGVAKKAGEQIDVPKLTALLDGQRKSGKIDPKLSQLASLLGNEDLATKQNEGFSWKQFTISPDKSGLTMAGTYDGDPTLRFATPGGDRDPNAEVVFSGAGDVANLLSNQYNQVWNQPGAAALKNELNLKNNLIDSSVEDAEARVATAVGQLTNEVEAAIIQIGGENGPAVARKMKEALAGLPYDQQLEILREQAGNLSLDTGDIITPEVEEAAAGEKQTIEADDSDAKEEPEASSEKTLSPKEEAKLQKQLEIAKQQLERQKKIGDRGKLSGGTGYIDQAEKRVRDIESKLASTTQQAAPQSSAETPIQDENPEIQATAEAAEAATDEELAAGKVQVTPEGIKALKEKLEAKGISILEDMKYATRAEQQYMRAMLSTIAANEDQREDYMTRMNNVLATGNADFDSKTLGEAVLANQQQATAQQNADAKTQTADTGRLNYYQNLSEHNFKVSEEVGGRIRDIFDDARGAIYGEDGDGNLNKEIDFDKGRFFSQYSPAFNKMYQEYLKAQGPEAQSQTRLALNSMVSMGIQALAESEDYGSFIENFIPDGGIDHIGSNDVYLDRLIITPDGRLAVIDRGTGQQADETIPVAVARRLFGETAWKYVEREIKGGPDSARGQANNKSIVD
jgi:hypothetical protein